MLGSQGIGTRRPHGLAQHCGRRYCARPPVPRCCRAAIHHASRRFENPCRHIGGVFQDVEGGEKRIGRDKAARNGGCAPAACRCRCRLPLPATIPAGRLTAANDCRGPRAPSLNQSESRRPQRGLPGSSPPQQAALRASPSASDQRTTPHPAGYVPKRAEVNVLPFPRHMYRSLLLGWVQTTSPKPSPLKSPTVATVYPGPTPPTR